MEYCDPSGYAKNCSGKGNNKNIYNEYEIVPYDNRKFKTSGFEKHHGILNEWAEHNIKGYTKKNAPTILLSKENHELTKKVYREWLKKNYGKPVGVSPDWGSMTWEEAMKITEDMFDAAKVPKKTRDEYMELFYHFILGG